MKKYLGKIALLTVFSLLAAGCEKTSETWENVKTAGRYVNKGLESIFGNETESCMVNNAEEFTGPGETDFIPLNDADLLTQFKNSDMAVPQPKNAPGEKNSSIASIDQFKNPAAKYGNIFQLVHFATDDHILRSKADLNTVMKIATFMKKNPGHHLIVEGHCDERASAAYNMALGTKRANHVRMLLIKQGVDASRIYPISYGKEKPVVQNSSPESWQQNRRAQFKIYEKQN